MSDKPQLVAPRGGGQRWPSMPKSDRKRLNTQIDDSMAAVLQRWQDEWGKSESEVVRVALQLGLQSLRRDPSPLGPRPLNPDDMLPPTAVMTGPPAISPASGVTPPGGMSQTDMKTAMQSKRGGPKRDRPSRETPHQRSAKWPIYTDPNLPEDGMYLFTRPFGLALLMHPKHVVRVMDVITCGTGGKSLRCGPYTTPSGKQWAVVKDHDTGRRSVVDWPCEGVAA